MTDEDKLLRLESSLLTLVGLAQKADERLTRIEEAQLRTEERWALAEERWARAEERWARTEEGVRSLLAIAEIHEREINGLVEMHARLLEAQAELAKAQAELAKAQARTDEQMAETNQKLNALIDTVERYISERRNGKAP